MVSSELRTTFRAMSSIGAGAKPNPLPSGQIVEGVRIINPFH